MNEITLRNVASQGAQVFTSPAPLAFRIECIIADIDTEEQNSINALQALREESKC